MAHNQEGLRDLPHLLHGRIQFARVLEKKNTENSLHNKFENPSLKNFWATPLLPIINNTDFESLCFVIFLFLIVFAFLISHPRGKQILSSNHNLLSYFNISFLFFPSFSRNIFSIFTVKFKKHYVDDISLKDYTQISSTALRLSIKENFSCLFCARKFPELKNKSSWRSNSAWNHFSI